jgi:hypothetical protein
MMLVIISAVTNRRMILETFTLAELTDIRLITLKVTDENVIGMIDIEIKIRKISPKGCNILPKPGSKSPIIPAHTAENNVMYPFPKIIIHSTLKKDVPSQLLLGAFSMNSSHFLVIGEIDSPVYGYNSQIS